MARKPTYEELEQRVKESEKEVGNIRALEKALKEAREYAENIVDTVREPLLVLDADLRVLSASRSFYQTFNVTPEETKGTLLYDLGNQQWDIPKLRELLEGILPENTSFDDYEVEHDFEHIGKRKMYLNARRIYRESNKTQLILLAIEDVTDIRREKLAVLGQLAGGVGHELRNPLGAIKSAAYFLNMVLEKPEPEVKETLEILEKEVGTSERIISSILDFARPKPPTRRKVDVNSVLQEALSHTTVPGNVKVVSQLDEMLLMIMADPDQLGQVFKNIILNGIQAMPQGGKLMVKTSASLRRERSVERSVEPSEVPSPEWMAISFTDTGAGIPQENLGKLFEPLFTTKAKGIGLGLALTRTLVEGHGGTIEVQSEVGKGSTFTVKLPIGGKVGK
jgi:two-component system CheB/CheR fusion protein